jgi:hypothetical protein
MSEKHSYDFLIENWEGPKTTPLNQPHIPPVTNQITKSTKHKFPIQKPIIFSINFHMIVQTLKQVLKLQNHKANNI